MKKKDSANQPNSSFRLQEESTRKLNKTYNTAEQQQLQKTTNVLEEVQSNSNRLNKQNSKQLNHSNEELRQQKSTVRKLETPIYTSEQQQLNQTNNILTETTNTQSNLKNAQSTNVRQQYSIPIDVKDYTAENEQPSHNPNVNMKKQYSDVASDEFRQQKSTVSKVGKVLDTSSQKQINQTSSVTEGTPSGERNVNPQSSKLREQSLGTDKGTSSLSNEKFKQQSSVLEISPGSPNLNVNNSKLEKATTNESFQQAQQNEYSGNKSGQNTSRNSISEKKQFNPIRKDSHTANNSFRKKRYKLQKEQHFNGNILVSIENTLQSSAAKFQDELEQDDEGVKLVSQSSNVVRKLSTKAFRKLKLNARKLKRADDTSTLNRVPQKLRRGKITFVTHSDISIKNEKTHSNFRRKELKSNNFSKSSENPLSIEKARESSLKKISNVPVLALDKSTTKYQEALEKDDEGVKLVSQGATAMARASKKLSTAAYKINANSNKLGKQSTKLKKIRFADKKKMQLDSSRKTLQKKAIKKRMYTPLRNKNMQFKGVASSLTNRITNIFKKIGKFNFKDLKNLIGLKIAAALGSGLTSVLPFLLVAVLCLLIVGMLGSSHEKLEFGGTENITKEVRRWCPLIEQEAKAQGMEEYIDLISSIVQVESGGSGTKDIMQSSESAGYPPNYWSSETLSIRQGIKHLKGIVNILKSYNGGYENNTKLLAQAYNFGSAFARYVGNAGGSYSLEVAETYSRTVVAPSLGNFTGETYSYINDTSLRLGKPYLYRNGGNFMYGELVGQYGGCSGSGATPPITGDFAIVLAEVLKYEGMPYVWGGKTPKSGFDCSGLISWGMKKIGVNIPSYSVSQYNLTVPVHPLDAQPGDLIFFKGTYGSPNQISHVEFYIDDRTMYGSNGSGVGYHNWAQDPYWQAHFAGIRRIVK